MPLPLPPAMTQPQPQPKKPTRPTPMLPLMPRGMDADAARGDADAGIHGKRRWSERGGGSLPRPQTSSYPFLG